MRFALVSRIIVFGWWKASLCMVREFMPSSMNKRVVLSSLAACSPVVLALVMSPSLCEPREPWRLKQGTCFGTCCCPCECVPRSFHHERPTNLPTSTGRPSHHMISLSHQGHHQLSCRPDPNRICVTALAVCTMSDTRKPFERVFTSPYFFCRSP